MAVGDYIEKYGVLIIGLMIGGGFAFGGIASYSGIAGGGSQNPDDGREEFNPVSPEETVGDGPFNLSTREQLSVAVQENSVFVNLLYYTEEEKSGLKELKQISSSFQGTVYVRTVNYTNSELTTQFALVRSDVPSAIVIGGNTGYNSPVISSPNRSEISSAVCSAARSYSSFPSCVV